MSIKNAAAIFFVAAMGFLPLGAAAATAGQPIILDVHGLDFHKFSCSEFSAINKVMGGKIAVLSRPGCGLAAEVPQVLKPDEWFNTYLAKDIERLCPGCDRRDFYWSGAIHESRKVVDQLSASIRSLSAEALISQRPFVIISHSWGTVLMAQTLYEMDVNGETISVDQLVTLASPLGGAFYKTAVDSIIADSLFREVPIRARSIKRWVNYYSRRDVISHSLRIADANISIDKYVDPSYEQNIRDFMSDRLHYPDTPIAVIKEAADGLAKIELGPTVSGAKLWHSAYMEVIPVYQPGADPVLLDLGAELVSDYLNPPVYSLEAAK